MDPKLNERTDDELVLLFKSGSGEAFEELVYRYKNSLYQYIMAMVQDEGAAGDLFQEVFISFFKHADKYQPRGKFKSWLFLTARNKVLNFFRDRDPLASLDQTDEEGNAFLHDTLPDGAPSPLEGLAGRETEEEIRRASLALPQRQREMIYLRQYLSFKEIAELISDKMYIKESQMSFKIEGDTRDADRIAKYNAMLKKYKYGIPGLNKKSVIDMQNVIVQQDDFTGDYREIQNFIGHGGRADKYPIVDYIPPAPEDVRELMSGLYKMHRYLSEDESIDPVVAGSAMHLAFTAIHPLSDGNGRISRTR